LTWNWTCRLNQQKSFHLFQTLWRCNLIYSKLSPFHVISLIHLWYILDIFQILRHSFLEFFKLEKITTMQVLGLVEDECWTFFMFSFMESKLKKCFNNHFHIIVGMYFQTLYNLNIFPYDATFRDWKEQKPKQILEQILMAMV
jgi:hypothetical protein